MILKHISRAATMVALLILFVGCHTKPVASLEHRPTIKNSCVDPSVEVTAALRAPQLSTQEIEALAEEPTDFATLLSNVKVATDHDLLVQTEFYDDVILKRFFGASDVEWTAERRNIYSSSASGPVRFAKLTGMRGKLVGVTVDLEVFRQCTAVLPDSAVASGYEPPLNYDNGYLHVHTGSLDNLDLRAVRAVFGTDATEEEGFCVDEGFAGYCAANSVKYTQHEKEHKYPVPFRSHYVDFTPADSPQRSADRRTVHFSDDSKIALITLYQFEE